MKLIYYSKTENFGDALNPLIFNKFFPNFFDEDRSSVFLGIGSVLHFKFPEAKKKVVFSTGYAYYGEIPKIDNSYEIVCVRGPLTAQKLGLNKNLAITDGAALLKTFHFPDKKKKYPLSFIPHHESASFFDWKTVCEEVGYNYIDPLDDHQKIIDQILESEVVIAEAMHGAIVADTLRIPWVPLKLYPSHNDFKWKDWTSSLNMDYSPRILKPMYTKDVIQKKVAVKLNSKSTSIQVKGASKIYEAYQKVFLDKAIIQEFNKLKFEKTFLSNSNILDVKVEQLMDKIKRLQDKYEVVQKH